MIIPYSAQLDLIGNNHKIDNIKCVIGDTNAYKLNINIVQGNTAADLTNHTAKITFLKPDNTTVFQDLTIDDAPTGKAHVTFDSQVIAVSGTVKAEINIYDTSTGRLTSGSFAFVVKTGLLNESTVESSNEFSALVTALSTVTDFINTKTDVTNLKSDMGTDPLETTSQNIKAAVNELNSSLADITNNQLPSKADKTSLDTTNSTVAAKADKTYVDTQIQSVSSNIQGFYPTVADLNTAFPTGNNNNYVVNTDNYIYRWNGTAWTSTGYLFNNTAFADNSITPPKINMPIADLIPLLGLPTVATTTNGDGSITITFPSSMSIMNTNKEVISSSSSFSVNVPNQNYLVLTWINGAGNLSLANMSTSNYGTYTSSNNKYVLFYHSSGIVYTRIGVYNLYLQRLYSTLIPSNYITNSMLKHFAKKLTASRLDLFAVSPIITNATPTTLTVTFKNGHIIVLDDGTAMTCTSDFSVSVPTSSYLSIMWVQGTGTLNASNVKVETFSGFLQEQNKYTLFYNTSGKLNSYIAEYSTYLNQFYNPSTIADNSIVEKQFAVPVVLGAKSKNLFNKDTITSGYYVSYTSGVLVANASYSVSDYIPILPNTTYSKRSNTQFAYYDSSKVYISGAISGTTFTTPVNSAYVRLSMLNSEVNIEQLELGNKSTSYDSFGNNATKYADKSIVSNKLGQDFLDQLNLNIYSVKAMLSDSSLVYGSDTSGSIAANPGGTPKLYLVTAMKLDITNGGKIKINTSLTNVNYLVACYNADGSYNSYITWAALNPDNSIKLPTGMSFIRITLRKTDSTEFMDSDNITISQSLNPNNIGAKNTTVKWVDINGSADYTSIDDAVQSEAEGTAIIVMPGTYYENVNAPSKKVTIIGVSKKDCILAWGSGNYDEPPLMASCGYIANMTIHADRSNTTLTDTDPVNKSYGVHIEADYSANKELEFFNCDIISDWAPAIGCGLRPNFTLKINDCLLFGNYVQNYMASLGAMTCLGAFYFHDSATSLKGDNQNIEMNNSKLKCLGVTAMTPSSQNDSANTVHLSFYKNMLWSEVNGKDPSIIWFKTAPSGGAWAGNNMYLKGDSFGNNMALLNA